MANKAEIQKIFNRHKKPAAGHAQAALLSAALSKIDLSYFENNNTYTEIIGKYGFLITALQTSVKPRTTAFFPQSIWIANNSNQAGINKAGMCAGLLLYWYKKLNSERNLIDCLNDTNPQANIDEISQLQTTCGKIIFDTKTAKSKLSETEFESFIQAGNDRKKYLNAACVDVMEFSPHAHQHKAFKEYFKHLEAENRECVGLHTISYISKEIDSNPDIPGHIIGWTAVESGFLLFDANTGEHYFDDYQNLTAYLFENYFTNNDYYFSMEDFYSKDDLQAIASLNTQTASTSKPMISSQQEWIEMDVYKTSQTHWHYPSPSLY